MSPRTDDEEHGPGCAGCQILGLLVRVRELEAQLATALADE